MAREFELKYAATPLILEKIRQEFDGFHEIKMETTYFDTPDGSLSAKRTTLRLRKENGASICTIKVPLGDGSRGEWECEAEDLESGIRSLHALGAPEIAQPPFTAICGARFTRLCCVLPTEDGTAELALDEGVLLGGSKEQPLCEVELELKSGSDEAVLKLAQEIADRYGLKPEAQSKFRRALNLAQGENHG